MHFFNHNRLFLLIAIVSCTLDIFSKYAVFAHYGSIVTEEREIGLDKLLALCRSQAIPALFSTEAAQAKNLSAGVIDKALHKAFAGAEQSLEKNAKVLHLRNDQNAWLLQGDQKIKYLLILHDNQLSAFDYYICHAPYVITPGENRPPHQIIPKIFNIQTVLNKGAVWGSFKGRIGLLTFLSAAAIIFIFYLLLKNQYGLLYQLSLGLIMGGALGNLWDRLYFGGVRDFLDFYISTHHWPTFNFADVYIVIGIGGYVLIEWLQGKSEQVGEK